MNFESFVSFIKGNVVKNFERDGKIVAVFISVNKSRRIEVIPINTISNLGKEGIATMLRDYCQVENPVYTAYISEANLLISQVEHINAVINNPLLHPSVHPDKIDVVHISFCANNGQRHNTIYRVIEIPKPKLEVMSDDDITNQPNNGLFSNLI
jgi:hypothetical protein